MLDTVLTWSGPFAPIVILGIRNVYGWAVNSFKDGEIQHYEIKALATTLLKLGGLGIMLSIGFDMDGVKSASWVAAVDAIRNDVLEPLFKVIKK